jgi:hypothetical protein
VDQNDNLYAGGALNSHGIAKWDGTSWSALGSGLNGFANAIVCDSSGNIYAGGSFTSTKDGSVTLNHIGKWDGSSWSALGDGTDEAVKGLACDSSGNVYACGPFSTAGGVSATRVARWGK